MLSIGVLRTDIHVVPRTEIFLILQSLPALTMKSVSDYPPVSDMWQHPLKGCGCSCILYGSKIREGRDVAAARHQVEGDEPQLEPSSKAAVKRPSGEELTKTPGHTRKHTMPLDPSRLNHGPRPQPTAVREG